MATHRYDEHDLFTLSGIGPHNAGAERQVVTPFELIQPIAQSRGVRTVSLRRWRHACRAMLAHHGPAGTLRAAGRADIDLLPHQLEPALALLHGRASRVLLADEVGLGKTIQAGLAMSELRHCGAAERLLVLTPAGLREQWAAELAGRFALDPTIVDMRDTRRRSAALPIGLNPWSTVSLAIASIDYVKRADVLPALLSCRWDVVVVDEAHGVTPGSDRYDAVEAICRIAPYVLLLTATPHSGDQRAFLALCGLGAKDGDPIVVFRRSRQEVRLGTARRVHQLMVRPSAEEQRMHALLAGFSRAVRVDRGDGDRDAWLALTILHKRAFSSPHSLEQSVLRRLSLLTADAAHAAAQGPMEIEQLLLPLDDPAGELDQADEAPLVRVPFFTDAGQERHHLILLADAARAAAVRDSKLSRLVRLVARLTRLGESAIIFTEYRDTLLHVRDVLPGDRANVYVLHGGMTRAERRAALDGFSSSRGSILLATDAAGEGLNLQSRCRVVINLELPWNPMRLEQRIGRVDRIGQPRTVHAMHLISRNTGETRILERLRARVARAEADLGAPASRNTTTRSPQSEEDTTSRLVIGYDTPETDATAGAAGTDAPTAEHPALSFVRCTHEAALEHARLARQRLEHARLTRHTANIANVDAATAAPCPTGVLVTHARRRTFRALLGPRTLVVMQTVCEDASGRTVAAHMTPLLVQTTTLRAEAAHQSQSGPGSHGMSGSCRTLRELIRILEAMPIGDWDPTFADWRNRTLRIHQAFWLRRLTNEQAIGRALLERSVNIYQPGLFDRRANRDRLSMTHEGRNMADDTARRIRMVEAAVDASIGRARAVLILTTRQRP